MVGRQVDIRFREGTMKNQYQQSFSILILCLALSLAACERVEASPTPIRSAETGRYVVIDADMGADDVMAILYLLQAEDVNVSAITVSGTGLAHCQPGMRTALGLLTLSEVEGVPVACGRETPLKGEVAFPSDWRAGSDSLSDRLDLPGGGEPSEMDAVELLTQTIQAAPNKTTLLTTGPLTNLAEALQAEPDLVDKIEMVYIMGGALEVPGNVSEQPTAEWNIYVDPYAANLVLRSGAPLTFVPLDATNQVPVTERSMQAFKDYQDTPAARAVRNLLGTIPYYWDPLTAAILTERSLGAFETVKLVVEESGKEIGRIQESEQGSNAQVAMTADGERFLELFLSVLNGGVEVDLPASELPPPGEKGSAFEMGSFYISYKTCSYDGAMEVPPGNLSLEFIAEPKMAVDNALAILTLDEGKTYADLQAWYTCDQPPWSTLVSFHETNNAQAETTSIEFNMREGPIYLICFSGPDPCDLFNVLEPIEVK
jgi:inosine-uridine nucleoside N-ribohydrolase